MKSILALTINACLLDQLAAIADHIIQVITQPASKATSCDPVVANPYQQSPVLSKSNLLDKVYVFTCRIDSLCDSHRS